jgi:N-acetylglucosamine-6-phosphate deacetylase
MRLGVAGAVIAGGLVPGDVEVEDGVISQVGLRPGGRGFALPGLVDLQVNGYGGVDFNEAAHDGFLQALAALRRDGVFAVQPTIITDSADNVARQLKVIAAVAADPAAACKIVGVHAEGPFLSPHHRGVHRPEYLRSPDQAIVEAFLAAGPLRTITIAPELDHAAEVTAWCARQGLIVQAGHSGASVEQAHAAFDAGARAVTHLFNGMADFRRRDPGLVGVTLTRPDVQVQLIADHVHNAPEVVAVALAVAEARTMLVTDASAAAGAPDGVTTVGGVELVVTDGVPRLPDGTLAGSTVTLMEQVGKLVRSGWPVDRAVNLASRRPAEFIGLAGAGTLQVGGPASLVVVDENIDVTAVLADGREISLEPAG